MKTHRRGIEARIALLLVSLVSTALLAMSCSAGTDPAGSGGSGGTAGTGATSGGASGTGLTSSAGGSTAATGGTGAMCPGGTTMCGGACVNTATDAAHCGSCTTMCAAGTVCNAGACQCSAGLNLCGTSCINMQSDPANCGACGTACQAGLFCSLGTCSNTCAAGLSACGAACVNTMTDAQNCGTCGTACGAGLACNAGQCACPAGQMLCGTTCTDTTSNALNCGSCGNVCGAGQTCSAGLCTGGGTGGAAGSSGAGGTAGTGTAGTGTAGTGGDNGTAPPGYWTYEAWHGCAWTGVGTAGQSTITPQDFTAQGTSGPYCVSGSVGAEPEYQSVALLGFNVAEPTTASCTYKPVDVNAPGPPSTTPMEGGIAINFAKRGADTGFTLRVQIQGPNGHKEGAVGEADRWCATITEVQGKVFVPYSAFTPKCWEMTDALKGTPYANQPISAVVFLVPGKPTATPYDFCINGFGYGTTAEDAPGDVMTGDQSGTVGGSGVRDLDFDRKKISHMGENYIIQNNNWGNPDGSDCILSYLNNSFTVTTCNGTGSSAPAAFPSIYQGNNGNTANGVLSTKSTDNMPRQVSQITSIPSTFRYSGGGGGEYNACYDIWFANSPPTAEYKDGIDGFVMIWLRDPSGKQPIGSNVGTATVGGMTWNVWVGPRGDVPQVGYNDAPVVSFVNTAENDNSRAQSFTNKDLKEFFTAAQAHGISGSMYLTDIFAGFEIWSGGVGLKVDEFTAVVQ